MVAVAGDFGIQLHLARAVARGRRLRRGCSPRGCACGCGPPPSAMLVVSIGCSPRRLARIVRRAPIAVLALVYTVQRSDRVPALLLSRAVAQRHRVVADACGSARRRWCVAWSALAWWPNVDDARGRDAAAGGRDARRQRAHRAAVIAGWRARLRDVEQRRRGRLRRRRSTASAIADLAAWPTFARDVWPIGAGIVLSALYFRIDVFLVQWWAGTELVALYNAVFPAGRGAAAVSGRGARRGAAVAVPRGAICGRSSASRRRSPSARSLAAAVLWVAAGVARAVRLRRAVRRRGAGVSDPAARRFR